MTRRPVGRHGRHSCPHPCRASTTLRGRTGLQPRKTGRWLALRADPARPGHGHGLEQRATPASAHRRGDPGRPGRCLAGREHASPCLVGQTVADRLRELVVRVDAALRDRESTLVVGYEHQHLVDVAGAHLQDRDLPRGVIPSAGDVGDHRGHLVHRRHGVSGTVGRTPPEGLQRAADDLQALVVGIADVLAGKLIGGDPGQEAGQVAEVSEQTVEPLGKQATAAQTRRAQGPPSPAGVRRAPGRARPNCAAPLGSRTAHLARRPAWCTGWCRA